MGATYMVIAAEHPLIEKYAKEIENIDEIRQYQDYASKNLILKEQNLLKKKNRSGNKRT